MDKFRLTECQTLDIPVGNDVPLLVKLVKGFDGCDGEGAVPFPIDVCENVVVTMVSERGQVKSVAHRLGTDGEVLLELQAGDFRAGLTYGIDVRATLNGKAVHAYGKSLVRITAATERGPRQVAQAADPYEVTLQVGYVGDVIPRRLDELEGYDELMDEVDGKADAAAVNEALEAVGREFQKYIPVAQKAVAGGVASLNGEKKVPTDQLQFPLRGQLTPSQIDSTSLADGVYQVNGKVISPDILGGAQANGVLVQYPWDSRVQTLFVGRAAAHADGEQVEIYTRRYLPTPKRWTAWMRIDGQLPQAMSQAEAEAGTATAARLISGVVLKAVIEKLTKDKASISIVDSSIKTAIAAVMAEVEKGLAESPVEEVTVDDAYADIVIEAKPNHAYAFPETLYGAGGGVYPRLLLRLPDDAEDGDKVALYFSFTDTWDGAQSIRASSDGVVLSPPSWVHFDRIEYDVYIGFQRINGQWQFADSKFESQSIYEVIAATPAKKILALMEDLKGYALKEELPDTLAQFKVGEEVLVGEWTEDGVTYDLYRKVVSFGALPNAGQKTVAHGIADKVKFVGVSAMASNGFPIPFPTQDTGKNIYVALGNNLITINTHATDRSSLTADVTILFTRNKPV